MKTMKQMSNTPKNKILIAIIALLLITNISLLAFMLWGDGHRKGHRGDRKKDVIGHTLQNDIGFNHQQMDQYRQMKQDHWDKMKPLFADMQVAKDSFYRLLQQPAVNDSVLNQSSNTIGVKQKAIDVQIFRHFKELRELCTPQQQPAFDSLIQRIVHKMSVPHRKGEGEKEKGKYVK